MRPKQTGFTLIELMIGLLLSMVVIGAIAKVFIDSNNSSKKQKSLSFLVEDGRYVQEVLAKEFRRAGYLRNQYLIGGLPTDIFKDDTSVLGSTIHLTAGEYIHGDINTTGFDPDGFDINHFVFRYQLNDVNDLSANNPDYAASPCTKDIHLTAGEDPSDPTTPIVVTIYFYVALDSASTPVLFCNAKRVNLKTGVTTNSPAAIPLIANIDRLYVLYGVDSDSDTFADQYLRADQVNIWRTVVSVRLYLALRSEESNIAINAPGYTLDGRKYSVINPGENRLYKVLTTTLAFRNEH